MRRRDRDERGAVLVEFALIVPVLLALVFGIIAYGYMLSYRQGLSQAASEGARAAAILPSGVAPGERATRATAAANGALDAYGVRCVAGVLTRNGAANGTCSIRPSTPCPEDASRSCAVVTLTHAYRDHPLVSSFPGLGITLPRVLSYTAVVEVS